MEETAILAQKLKSGHIPTLSRLMTFAESNLEKHREKVRQIIELAGFPKKESIRIGISGSPGVGKSTFIESFGKILTSKGKKIAVLAVDPSSPLSKGSILGDKTRMEDLAKDPNAFIRPSPSSGELGGLARKTIDLMKLCELAGFDAIIVETVGVGQSETDVKYLTDIFVLMILPGGGDDLQGIKKGAVELADMIVINKSDGDNNAIANITKSDYLHAMKIIGGKKKARVFNCSAEEETGIDEIWLAIQDFIKEQKESGAFSKNRKEQLIYWFEKQLKDQVLRNYLKDNKSLYDEVVKEIMDGKQNLHEALGKFNQL